MLPKPRVLSALFLGLGITLVVAALVAPRFITTDARLPLNVDTSTLTLTLSDPDARMSEKGQVSTVGVTKQIHQTIQQPTDADSATVRVGLTVMRDGLQSDLERLHEATIWTYRMNRLTGDFESPLTLTYQLAAPTNDIVAQGGWLKFPVDAQQTTYQIFDSTLRESRPAQFVESLTMQGRTVYHYRQVIEPTNVAKLYDSVTNTSQIPLEDGTTAPASLFHSTQRDFFVDQRTGLIANLQEDTKDYYETAEGLRQEALTFNGEATSSSVASVLRLASTFPSPSRAKKILAAVAVGGGVIALLGFGGVFGLFGGTDRKRAARRKAKKARKQAAREAKNHTAERKKNRQALNDGRTKTVAELQAEYADTSGGSEAADLDQGGGLAQGHQDEVGSAQPVRSRRPAGQRRNVTAPLPSVPPARPVRPALSVQAQNGSSAIANPEGVSYRRSGAGSTPGQTQVQFQQGVVQPQRPVVRSNQRQPQRQPLRPSAASGSQRAQRTVPHSEMPRGVTQPIRSMMTPEGDIQPPSAPRRPQPPMRSQPLADSEER